MMLLSRMYLRVGCRRFIEFIRWHSFKKREAHQGAKRKVKGHAFLGEVHFFAKMF